MKTRFYYDPIIRKDENGGYYIDIYISFGTSSRFFFRYIDSDYNKLINSVRHSINELCPILGIKIPISVRIKETLKFTYWNIKSYISTIIDIYIKSK